MSRIRIKHFGPIKEGYSNNDGWLEIKNLCVFIGTQGSGKSTVAKLISTLIWIEKALVRGDFGANNKFSTARFRRHVAYQNIGSYFNEKSIIEYDGGAFFISYRESKVTIHKHKADTYVFPKIMYVPSERNLVSSVINVNDLQGLPQTLYTFSREYDLALRDTKGLVPLPINGSNVEYKKGSKDIIISGDGYTVSLLEASSGFQSFVPLYLVSNFLSNSLTITGDNATKNISINQEKRIQKDIQKILSNPKLSEDVKKASLEFLSSGTKPAAFINIVEEPEQNLFPSSQHQIINSLLEIKNRNANNKLILTTHSPYIITYLSIAIQGGSLMNKDLSESALNKLRSVVPERATLKAEEIAVFQLDQKNGEINDLPNFEGIPSDSNYLNQFLSEGNVQFDTLLEIEQEL
ncbi:AAA family ATPase [Mucilaginibacter aquariorum]|uniref:ATP-binding protein n=1 Tax=Mucilaginibacter aquariorum TaxID=2967225 RepID=A0ABT1SZ39_9SPHI|nr:AAA family ATPase [Mucilaginibacter aquariorum]MCQ6957616.1 ATP-binding protein [Mucilaginibacter aquariorum]